MCYKTTCATCGKPTWAGCGKHIDTALAGVPEEERCTCKPHTQKAQDESGEGSGGCVLA